METITSGQLILGTDKRNPHLSVYEDADEGRLSVFYGLELLEVVSNQPEHPAFKLMVGRFYNAGVKVRTLEQVFEVDRKTMQRWGRALHSGNEALLWRVLAGRQQARKLTLQIEGYVRTRWPMLQAEGCRNFRQRLRQEIQQIFGVSLSGEALRPLLQRLRREAAAAKAGAPTLAGTEPASSSAATTATEPGCEPASDRAPVEPASEPVPEKRETTCESSAELAVPTPPSQPATDQVLSAPCSPPPPALPTHKTSPIFPAGPEGLTRWCDHAGVLLFSDLLDRLPAVLKPREPILAQWVASLLLGAVNLEQTKFLNWEELRLGLGQVVRLPTLQRDHLSRLAQAAQIEALFGFNAQELRVRSQHDFYLDPHTKHYTGQQNVLKGWCPKIRWADKALHADYVHTAAGHPFYFELTDNYADLRQRLPGLIARTRAVGGWPADWVLNWVVDRGAFGRELFIQMRDMPADHLITWEKDYHPEPWPASAPTGRMEITRARNSAHDTRSYHFEYLDEAWPKLAGMRRLRVRATNPAGRTIEVGVLTNDLQRAAIEIVRLIFMRWLQENDFKYLDKHFGINQIVSYQSVPYAELKGQLEDRQMRSGAYQALQQQRRALEQQQARKLLEHQRAQRRQGQQQRRLEAVQAQLAATVAEPAAAPEGLAALRAQRARLKAAQTQGQSRVAPRQKAIDELSVQIEAVQAQMDTTAQEVSRLDTLIAEGKVRLHTPNKQMLDALKVIARNAFYVALQPFKAAYNNYRDDHDYFRHLTQASGVLELRAGEIWVHLLPRVNYAPQLRRIIDQCLDQVNAAGLTLPDGSGRRLHFRLAHKRELQLTLKPGS